MAKQQSHTVRSDEHMKRKTRFNRDLVNLYKATNEELSAWAGRHEDYRFMAQQVENKIYGMQMSAAEMINDWRTDTATIVIEKEWVNIQNTARRANQIAHAFFIIIESDKPNKTKLVEDLLDDKVSPGKFLQSAKVPDELVEYTEETIVDVPKQNVLNHYRQKVVDYKALKNKRKASIDKAQQDERKRNDDIKKSVAAWKAKFKDYHEVGMWLDCLVDEGHSNAWGVISLLSADDDKVNEDLTTVKKIVNNSEYEINKVMTLVAHYDVVFKEREAARKEAERLAREDEERKREEQRKEEERIRMEKIQKLKDKFSGQNPDNVETNKQEKKMTKAKEIKNHEAAVVTKPKEEELVLTIDDAELEGISFSRFDIHKANNICIESGRLKLSKAITELIYNKGYQKVMPLEQKGSMFLVFPRAMGEDISLAESGDDMFGYIDSETIASKVLAHTKGDKNYQEYKVQVGSPKGQDYIYAKITENINN